VTTPTTTASGETSLQPLNSVEIWDAYVDNFGTLYYALLNRNSNYRAEVWRRRSNGISERVWVGEATFKFASISIAPSGRSLVIVYSRANGPDSKTPYQPYMRVLANILN